MLDRVTVHQSAGACIIQGAKLSLLNMKGLSSYLPRRS